MRLLLFNVINACLPYRPFFGLRRHYLRFCGLKIGRGVRIASGVRFYGRNTSIGDETWIGPESCLISNPGGAITVGDHVDIGPQTLIVTGGHHVGDSNRRAGDGTATAITIGRGSWIGARAMLLGGAHVGTGSVVAGGAVVVAALYPDDVLLAGVPVSIKHAYGERPEQTAE